jgi:hypothetical protein
LREQDLLQIEIPQFSPRASHVTPNPMESIIKAIIDDDQMRVEKLLSFDPGLATLLVDKTWLYESKIVHWIYVGDTALHLAPRSSC